MANDKQQQRRKRGKAGGPATDGGAAFAVRPDSEETTDPGGLPSSGAGATTGLSEQVTQQLDASELASLPSGASLAAAPEATQAPAPGKASSKPKGGTLASRVSDAAAAQLLIFDELPADEKPRPGDRVLLVGIVWGGSTLVELEQVSGGGDLAAGRLFDLPNVQLNKNFRIVKHVGEGHVFTVPAALKTEVHQHGQVISFEQLSAQGKAQRVDAPFRGFSYTVQPDDRIVAQVAPNLVLIARYVRAARFRDKTFLEQLDLSFTSTLVVAMLLMALFWLMVSITPREELSLIDELARNQSRYTKYQVKAPPPPEKPKFKDLAGVQEGAKAKGDEGKLGKDDAKKKEADASQKGAPVVDPDKKEKDRQKIMKLGLINALNKMGVKVGGGAAASDVLGPGGLGIGTNTSLGGTRAGAGAGDAYGVGGLGSRGAGAGGGGTALGIGGLGTKGGGRGAGGYGDVDLGGRGKEETQFVPGRTVVVGGLSREVINRIIQRHYNEIKYCYEKELTKDPGLYGKVTVLFVIGGSGRVEDALVQQTTMSSEPVESCMLNHVKRWAFPQPQGGGTVQVTYPYVFKSSGT